MRFKHIFIVNPVAGQGKALRASKIIEEYCSEKQISYKIYYTTKPNEAVEIVKHLGDNNIIYSVGGDGTLREVVSGIVDTNNILSVIPAGSGNDFVKSLIDLPPTIQQVDLGLANKHYFINIASLGIDAEIANNVELMKQKHIPNGMLYNASIIYSLSRKKDPTLEFYGGSEKVTLLAVCNGKYYGHGIKIAPDANLQDGFFDIYRVGILKKYQIPTAFLKIVLGSHEDLKHVTKFYDTSFIVTSKEEIICNIDGDIIKGKEFNFELIPKAISFDNGDELGIKKLIKKTL